MTSYRREKFENAALFLWLGLPSILIRHGNGAELFENALQSGGIWKRLLFVFAWKENILKKELYENSRRSHVNHVISKFLQRKCERN